MNTDRYDRNIRFFGQEGQDRLAACSVAVVGVGGLGTHVVQQLALLGIGKLALIDKGELKETAGTATSEPGMTTLCPGHPRFTLGNGWRVR